MKNNIIDFPTKNGWMTGEAFCLRCKHKWTAVSPSGTDWLECPNCKSEKGKYKYHTELPEGTLMRVCVCGNDLFYITPDAHLCPQCGLYQKY